MNTIATFNSLALLQCCNCRKMRCCVVLLLVFSSQLVPQGSKQQIVDVHVRKLTSDSGGPTPRDANDPSLLSMVSSRKEMKRKVKQPMEPTKLKCESCIEWKVKCPDPLPCARCWQLCRTCSPPQSWSHGRPYYDLVLSTVDPKRMNHTWLQVFHRLRAERRIRPDVFKTMGLAWWRTMSRLSNFDITHGLLDETRLALEISPVEFENEDSVRFDVPRGGSASMDGHDVAAIAQASQRLRETGTFRALDDGVTMLAVSALTPLGHVFALNDAFKRYCVLGAPAMSDLFRAKKILPVHAFASVLAPDDREVFYEAVISHQVGSPITKTALIKVCLAGDIDVWIFRWRQVVMAELPDDWTTFLITLEPAPPSKHIARRPGHPHKRIDGYRRTGSRAVPTGPSAARDRVTIPGIACFPVAPLPHAFTQAHAQPDTPTLDAQQASILNKQEPGSLGGDADMGERARACGGVGGQPQQQGFQPPTQPTSSEAYHHHASVPVPPQQQQQPSLGGALSGFSPPSQQSEHTPVQQSFLGFHGRASHVQQQYGHSYQQLHRTQPPMPPRRYQGFRQEQQGIRQPYDHHPAPPPPAPPHHDHHNQHHRQQQYQHQQHGITDPQGPPPPRSPRLHVRVHHHHHYLHRPPPPPPPTQPPYHHHHQHQNMASVLSSTYADTLSTHTLAHVDVKVPLGEQAHAGPVAAARMEPEMYTQSQRGCVPYALPRQQHHEETHAHAHHQQQHGVEHEDALSDDVIEALLDPQAVDWLQSFEPSAPP